METRLNKDRWPGAGTAAGAASSSSPGNAAMMMMNDDESLVGVPVVEEKGKSFVYVKMCVVLSRGSSFLFFSFVGLFCVTVKRIEFFLVYDNDTLNLNPLS